MWSLLKELFAYAREHKKLVFLPMIIVLVLLGALLVFAQVGAGAVHLHDLLIPARPWLRRRALRPCAARTASPSPSGRR